MKPTCIVSLDARDSQQVQAVSALHASCLPDSLISRLGPVFREKFYYRELVREGLIRSELYSYEGRYVGFIAYTFYPFTFMERGKNGHPIHVAGVVLRCLLERPARLGLIPEVLRQSSQRKSHAGEDKVGEALSIGVLESHASSLDPESGLRIPYALFERATQIFETAGIREVLLTVRKDNLKSLLFFRSLGAEMRPENVYIPRDCLSLSLRVGGSA